MSKISTDERKVRRKRLSTEATSYVAKSEQLNFRLDAPTNERLYLLAEKQTKPVGALVR
ncbi:MAG: hypothetical protein IAF58_05420 [Leptolyngbya sp.]|nr:hypothetical protein [Candidatus Melainabacteria bacterium]